MSAAAPAGQSVNCTREEHVQHLYKSSEREIVKPMASTTVDSLLYRRTFFLGSYLLLLSFIVYTPCCRYYAFYMFDLPSEDGNILGVVERQDNDYTVPTAKERRKGITVPHGAGSMKMVGFVSVEEEGLQLSDGGKRIPRASRCRYKHSRSSTRVSFASSS